MNRLTLLSFILFLVSAPLVYAAESGWTDAKAAGSVWIAFTLEEQSREAVGIELIVTMEKNSQIKKRKVTCGVRNGAASEMLRCENLNPIPLTEMSASHLKGYLVVQAELRQLSGIAAKQGFSIVGVDLGDDPLVSKAEAGWVGLGPFGTWVCELEDSDMTNCAASCGGANNIESLEVDEYPAGSNNPFAEHSCEVTCSCKNGTESRNIDPPQVLTSG